ncbi:hypothetical protein BB560_002777 [Smittium megazygosporum]|uniref:MCM OB domain-containing protein n=1 Tax=Smittium megazygosporum TaxID=133381 RepID=A0A2T9ZDT0_9FUNG|nr:hypothetical protein BB560_002777 [Smittium megazygosporum]
MAARASGNKRQRLVNTQIAQFVEYWDLYFTTDLNKESSECHQALVLYKEILERIRTGLTFKLESSLYLNFYSFLEAAKKTFNYHDENTAETKLSELQAELINFPERTLNIIAAVCSCILGEHFSENRTYFLTTKLKVQLFNHIPITSMKSIKASMYKKLVTIRGTVVRTSLARPLLVEMQFNCVKCNRPQRVKSTDGKLESPVKCITIGCRSKMFIQSRSGIMTKTIDWQELR